MDDKVNPCRFLALPAELRNRIYRLVLLQPFDIQFPHRGPFPVQPSLIATCRQIRKESHLIYLKENHFTFAVPNLNATDFIKWTMASKIRRRAKVEFVGTFTRRKPLKANLLKWLEARHQRHVLKRPGEGDESRYMKAAAGIFEVAKTLRREQKMSWEQIKPLVEGMMEMLAHMDPKWAS